MTGDGMSCQEPSVLSRCVDPGGRSDLILEETILSTSSTNGHDMVSRGFHIQASLQTSLKRRSKHDCIGSTNERVYDVLMIYRLPKNCYIDPLELQNYRVNFHVNGLQQSPSLQIQLHTYKATIDTEVIAEEAEETVYVIEVLGVDMMSKEKVDYCTLNISYNIPIHVRYHRARANGNVVSFRVDPPVVLSRAAIVANLGLGNSDNSDYKNRRVVMNRVYDKTHLGNLGNANGLCSKSNHRYAFVGTSKEDLHGRNKGLDISVPVGNTDIAELVNYVTTLTALFTMMIIIYAIMKL